MEAFGIIGTSLGAAGFVFALMAFGRISALEKRLNELGILEEKDNDDGP